MAAVRVWSMLSLGLGAVVIAIEVGVRVTHPTARGRPDEVHPVPGGERRVGGVTSAIPWLPSARGSNWQLQWSTIRLRPPWIHNTKGPAVAATHLRADEPGPQRGPSSAVAVHLLHANLTPRQPRARRAPRPGGAGHFRAQVAGQVGRPRRFSHPRTQQIDRAVGKGVGLDHAPSGSQRGASSVRDRSFARGDDPPGRRSRSPPDHRRSCRLDRPQVLPSVHPAGFSPGSPIRKAPAWRGVPEWRVDSPRQITRSWRGEMAGAGRTSHRRGCWP